MKTIQYGYLTERARFNVQLRAENLEYSFSIDDPKAGYRRYACGKLTIDYSPLEQIQIENFRVTVDL